MGQAALLRRRARRRRGDPDHDDHTRAKTASIDVEDVTTVHDALVRAGHEVRRPVEERWYARTDDEVGTRELAVADPDGYLLRPNQDVGTRPLRQGPTS